MSSGVTIGWRAGSSFVSATNTRSVWSSGCPPPAPSGCQFPAFPPSRFSPNRGMYPASPGRGTYPGSP
eukprot:1302087-Prymnesium_polylepis.1